MMIEQQMRLPRRDPPTWWVLFKMAFSAMGMPLMSRGECGRWRDGAWQASCRTDDPEACDFECPFKNRCDPGRIARAAGLDGPESRLAA